MDKALLVDEADDIRSALSQYEPSPEAQAALSAFKKEHWDDYRTHYTLLTHLVPLLTDRSELVTGSEYLPADIKAETSADKKLRCSILHRLVNAVSCMGHELPESEPNDYGYDYYNFMAKVLYWHLNRQPRQPSGFKVPEPLHKQSGQAGGVNSRQHDEWPGKILDMQGGEIASRIAQKSIRQKGEAGNSTRTGDPATDNHTDPAPITQSAENDKTRKEQDAFLGEPQGIPLSLNKIGPVDHILLLDHLISIVSEKFQDRYGQALSAYQGNDLCTELMKGLVEGVQNLSMLGNFDLESLLGLSGMPETSSRSGVCLHILWRECNPGRMWLYVGQASKLLERIAFHNDPWYRRTHPSLHYHVWNAFDDIKSEFVTLVLRDSVTCETDRCLLNIQEMWMACLFQTLTPKHLDEYLPLDAKKLWSGRHLNVVPPIWQGFTGNFVPADAVGGRQTFSDLILSPDPVIRRWAKHMRDSFNELRNSPDPILREYYYLNMSRNRELAEEATMVRKLNNVQQYLSGVWRTVTGSDSSQGAHLITCSDFSFTISRHLQLGVHVGDRVQMRFYLTESPNPRAYAKNALPTDPSSRLAVAIKGQGSRGPFHVWLSNRAERVVMKMNSLVDALEGFTLKESREFGRRWFVERDPTSS